MNAKTLLARRRQERLMNALDKARKAQDALDAYISELGRRDPKLKKLFAESDAAEREVAGMRG